MNYETKINAINYETKINVTSKKPTQTQQVSQVANMNSKQKKVRKHVKRSHIQDKLYWMY